VITGADILTRSSSCRLSQGISVDENALVRRSGVCFSIRDELSGAGAGRQWRGHVIDVTKRWREPVNDAEAAFDLVRLQLHAAMDDDSGKSRWAEARKRN
jgi:hypothetical protein